MIFNLHVLFFSDSLSSTINLNRTDAALNCSSGYMSIELKFRQKFYGIVYADYDRNSACKVSGNGEEKTKIQLPLKGCGTVQVSYIKVYTNDINRNHCRALSECSPTTLLFVSTLGLRLKETR